MTTPRTLEKTFVLRGSTEISLHERFSKPLCYRLPEQVDFDASALQHTQSTFNHGPDLEMENRPSAQESLLQQDLRQQSVKARLGWPMWTQPLAKRLRGRVGWRSRAAQSVRKSPVSLFTQKSSAQLPRRLPSRTGALVSPQHRARLAQRGKERKRVPGQDGAGKVVWRPLDVTKEDLDKELDDYMSTSKRRLNSELDAYMARSHEDARFLH